jgi:alpha-tubulin suppressor-like RCC1 family protein
MSTFGLRKDGTLWTWGTIHLFKPGGMVVATTFPEPAQVALETNWAGFASGFACLIRSRSGEVWQPFQALPSGDASVNTSCRLLASNALPQGIAVAVCGAPKLYQLRSGGTLWEKPHSFSSVPPAAATPWKQTGKRSDWVSLWSASGTAFGLTADGTIWTWGHDPTRPPQRSSASWLKMVQENVRNRLGAPGSGGGMSSYNQPPYQKEPRPLIRMSNIQKE